MHSTPKLLLADDDIDDCNFFKEALDELEVTATIVIVNNGVELMGFLNKNSMTLPDILFLDLNMPLKNGFECLSEIKSNQKLQKLPVIIFSTSFDKKVAQRLYELGAHYYIRKPAEFSKLKNVIQKSLVLLSETSFLQPEPEKFVLYTE